jgi:hypothetical protein
MKTFKQSTLLLTGLLFFVIISCKKTELAPATQQSLSTTAAQNASTSEASVQRFYANIDLSAPGWSEYNACNGNLINIIKGIWRIETFFIVNGKEFNIEFHTNTD